MLDQGRCDLFRILSTTRKNLEATMWETSFFKNRAKDPKAAGSKLVTFEDHCVACR